MKVGLNFVPASDPSATGLSEASKNELLGRVKAAFANRDFISEITIIPDTYLRSRRGFETVDQVARLYGLDVVALVSYDQVVFTDDTKLSLLYWTIVGAYLVKGSKNDVQTFVDAAVFDVKSRKLLFRAPGIDRIESRSTLINSPEETRKARDKSFGTAMADMTINLDKELAAFRERIKADRSVTVTQRAGSSRGGGGALGAATLLALAAALVAGTLRERRAAAHPRCRRNPSRPAEPPASSCAGACRASARCRRSSSRASLESASPAGGPDAPARGDGRPAFLL